MQWYQMEVYGIKYHMWGVVNSISFIVAFLPKKENKGPFNELQKTMLFLSIYFLGTYLGQ